MSRKLSLWYREGYGGRPMRRRTSRKHARLTSAVLACCRDPDALINPRGDAGRRGNPDTLPSWLGPEERRSRPSQFFCRGPSPAVARFERNYCPNRRGDGARDPTTKCLGRRRDPSRRGEATNGRANHRGLYPDRRHGPRQDGDPTGGLACHGLRLGHRPSLCSGPSCGRGARACLYPRPTCCGALDPERKTRRVTEG